MCRRYWYDIHIGLAQKLMDTAAHVQRDSIAQRDGRALRNFLGRLAGSGLGRKRLGLRLGRLKPKAIVSHPARILLEKTPLNSSGVFLGLPPHGEVSSSLLKTASAFASVDNPLSIRPQLSPETLLGMGRLVF